MGLSVTFVSGTRRSGKSAVIQVMVDRLWKKPPHYVRLVRAGSAKSPPKAKPGSVPQCGVSSAKWVEFTEDRIFEILPETLAAIHRQDRYGSVVLEADADPGLRCAYDYDHRVFVMPRPASCGDVFRDPHQAAKELHRALDDTAAFASEIFGLFQAAEDHPEPAEDRAELSGAHMRGFLYTPLGDELVTRIQLQPAYHGLVESDLVVVNTRLGPGTAESDECLRRIDQVLSRLRGLTDRRGQLLACDPLNPDDKDFPRMLEALAPMCAGGK